MYTTLGSKDIGIINSEFVAKTQFLCGNDLTEFFTYIETKGTKLPEILTHSLKPRYYYAPGLNEVVSLPKINCLILLSVQFYIKGLKRY